MSETQPGTWTETPSVEVRVFRHGALVHREWCETEEQASFVVGRWSELEGVECEVDDLTVRHRPDEILGSEPAGIPDEDRGGDSAR